MALVESLSARPAPVRTDTDGTLRIGDSRVTLDTVIEAFKDGNTLEAIVDKYPSLDLTDVYSVIAYYLWNYDTVERYLEERRREASEIRAKIERRFPSEGLRAQLLSRRAGQR